MGERALVESPAGQDGGIGSDALPAGARIGAYVVATVLGRGDSSITYQARDTAHDRDVALRELLPGTLVARQPDGRVSPRTSAAAEDFRRGRDRLLAEAQAEIHAALNDIPGIVSVIDTQQANGTVYLVTPLASGESLQARLQRDRRLSRLAIERIVAPVLDSLEGLHARGMLHRDVRPATIVIDRTDQPLLIHTGAPAAPEPAYAAPEQGTAVQPGPWSDIYALGATLYHCVAGVPPPAIVDRLRHDALVPAARAAQGHYPPALLAAIDAALRLAAAERPQSIADWRRLMQAAPVPAASRQQPRSARGRAGGRRQDPRRPGTPSNAPLWLAFALLVFCLAGTGTYAWLQAEHAAAARRAQEQEAAAAEAKARADAVAARKAQEAAAAWGELRDSTDAARLRSFADQFPGTKEAGQALARARDLETAVKRQAEAEAARRAAAEKAERARAAATGWAELERSEDLARLRSFADRFAGTPEAGLALARARDLEAAAKRQAEAEAARREAAAKAERAQAATAGWAELQASEDPVQLRSFADRFAGLPEARLALERADTVEASARKAVTRSERRPDEPVPPDSPRRDSSRDVTYDDGSRYVGDFARGLRNGEGTYTYANGDRYVGAWLDGDMHGHGVYTFADGGRYEGEWRHDKMHGRGVRVWADGDRYDGGWRDDKKHGLGTYISAKGERYDGEWANDAMHGHGVYTWADGSRYEGEWQNDHAHGYGTRRDPDGEVFAGTWRDGCFMEGTRAVAVGVPLKDCER